MKIGSYFLIVFFVGLLFYQCKNHKTPTPPVTEKTETRTEIISPKLNSIYNVYIENSASMNGYVKGVTEFEQSVYSYLTDINISKLADTFNLFYINSKIIPQGNDIASFIADLGASRFAQKGGNIGITDISGIIKLALTNTSNNTVSVLVSDFIFSPGRAKDANQYLVNQQIGIRQSIAEYLAKYPDHALIIYQLESKFEGIYYNREDTPKSIKSVRPFYIWIMGHADNLVELVAKCPETKFQGKGVKNSFAMVRGGKNVNYAIQYGSGNFKPDRDDSKKSIVNAKKDTKGIGDKKMRFSVNVDFSQLLCSDSYLMNPVNYSLSDKDYQLNIVKTSSGNFTHSLQLSTDIVKPTILDIKLKSSIPDWIGRHNDADGMLINDENMDKTYGLQYLINGVYEAFTKEGVFCTNIRINVNK